MRGVNQQNFAQFWQPAKGYRADVSRCLHCQIVRLAAHPERVGEFLARFARSPHSRLESSVEVRRDP